MICNSFLCEPTEAVGSLELLFYACIWLIPFIEIESRICGNKASYALFAALLGYFEIASLYGLYFGGITAFLFAAIIEYVG